jgi:hypothetical protein
MNEYIYIHGSFLEFFPKPFICRLYRLYATLLGRPIGVKADHIATLLQAMLKKNPIAGCRRGPILFYTHNRDTI